MPPLTPPSPTQEEVKLIIDLYKRNIPDGVQMAFSDVATVLPVGGVDRVVGFKALHILEEWSAEVGVPQDPEPPIMMLASLPKIPVMLALIDFLEEQKNSDVMLDMTPGAIVELMKRNYNHFSTSNFYTDLSQSIKVDIKSLTSSSTDIRRAEEERVLEQVQEYLKSSPLSVPIDEIAYQALALSSNTATEIANKYHQSVRGVEVIQNEVEKLVPSLKITQTTENDNHWLQERPNTGKIDEIATLLNSLVLDYHSGNISPMRKMLVEQMVNNPEAVPFSFTASKLATVLKQLYKVKIIEKTGLYPCVFWIRRLAEDGFPPHMVICTVVTIYDPNNIKRPIRTFTHSLILAMPFPEGVRSNKAGVIFPTTSDPLYQEFIELAYQIYWPKFRDKIESFIRDALSGDYRSI